MLGCRIVQKKIHLRMLDNWVCDVYAGYVVRTHIGCTDTGYVVWYVQWVCGVVCTVGM